MKKFLSLFLFSLCFLFSACRTAPVSESYPFEDLAFEDLALLEKDAVTSEEKINNAVTILRDLGFTELSDDMAAQTQEFFLNSPYTDFTTEDVMISLLSILGSGSYDFDTWTFTPSSSQVYAFDMEVFDIGNMYTQFFQGIMAINNDEFTITDIEDSGAVADEDLDLGLGLRKITFCYNQKSYEFNAKVMYDWFDGDIIGYMNKVFKKEKNPKRLYYMTDGYQECIIFYSSEEWAAYFSAVTGFTLNQK